MRRQLIHTINNTWQLKSLAFFIYMVQLVVALLIGLQVFQVLDASFSHSMEKWKLLTEFDRTVFEDIFNHHGGSLSPLVGMLRWILILYVPIYIWLQGGLIDALLTKNSTLTNFFAKGVQHFKKVAWMSLINLVLLGLWTIFVFGLAICLSGNPMEGMISEKPWVISMLVTLLLWIIGVMAIWVSMFVVKGIYIKYTFGLRGAIKKGWSICLRHSGKLAFGTLVFIIILFFTIYVGSSLSSIQGAPSWKTVIVIALGQQLLIFFRTVLKLSFYDVVFRISGLLT